MYVLAQAGPGIPMPEEAAQGALEPPEEVTARRPGAERQVAGEPREEGKAVETASSPRQRPPAAKYEVRVNAGGLAALRRSVFEARPSSSFGQTATGLPSSCDSNVRGGGPQCEPEAAPRPSQRAHDQ